MTAAMCLALSLGLGVLSGCGGHPVGVSAADDTLPAARWTSDIIDQQWEFAAFVAADSTQTPILDGTSVTLSFTADGSVHGHAGCNGYGGAWRLEETGDIQIGPLVSTRMACSSPEGVMQQEQRFMRALETTHEVTRLGEQLRVDYGQDGTYLHFRQLIREQARPEPFTGILWQLEHFEDIQGDAVTVSGLVPESLLTALFTDDGIVRGSAGCNAWGAQWSPAGDGRLVFSDIVATEMACAEPAGVMPQEERFLQALARMTQVVNDPEHLWLSSTDGSLVLPFVRRQEGVNELRSVRGGTSFGECLGYCWQELHLTAAGATLTQRGWNTDTYPARSARQLVETALWNRLSNLPDVRDMQSLDDTIGCPDCADGGAEWVEVETTSGSKRVTYEYGAPPKEIAELARVLAELRAVLLAQLEVRTVVR
mgnify:CR=1 FL=1